MNKDFFTKSISFKDIDFKSIKNIKNKKEILIGILILAFVIAVFIIGGKLLDKRKEVMGEYKRKESQYNSLISASSESEIKEKLESLEIERDELLDLIKAPTSTQEVNDEVKEFKKGSNIYWATEEIKLGTADEDSKYDLYTVDVNDFSASIQQVADFLTYVENYPKIVRVNSMELKQNQITGKLSGRIRMSFYFKKNEE